MRQARIHVYVQPRAAKSGVVGLHDGAIRIRLTAPPVDDAANAMLIDLIAEALGTARRNVRVVGGRSSRRKLVQIDGMTAEEAHAALLPGRSGGA